MVRQIGVQIDTARLQRLATGERKQTPGEIGAAERAAQNLLCQFGVLLIIPHHVEQEFHVADDDTEQIVEVVRDAAGKLADRLHLLRLAQLRFRQLLPGDVFDEAKQKCFMAVGIAQRGNAGTRRDNDARTGQVTRFSEMTRTRGLLSSLDQQVAIVDMGDVRDGHANQIIRFVTEKLAEREVCLDDALSFATCQHNTNRTFLENAPEPLLEFAYRIRLRLGRQSTSLRIATHQKRRIHRPERSCRMRRERSRRA